MLRFWIETSLGQILALPLIHYVHIDKHWLSVCSSFDGIKALSRGNITVITYIGDNLPNSVSGMQYMLSR